MHWSHSRAPRRFARATAGGICSLLVGLGVSYLTYQFSTTDPYITLLLILPWGTGAALTLFYRDTYRQLWTLREHGMHPLLAGATTFLTGLTVAGLGYYSLPVMITAVGLTWTAVAYVVGVLSKVIESGVRAEGSNVA